MARTPIHPGEILGDELEEIGLTAKRLADLIAVPPNRLYQILAARRNITADTALRLSRYFGTSADFWMNLQTAYELDLARQKIGADIRRIPKRNDKRRSSTRCRLRHAPDDETRERRSGRGAACYAAKPPWRGHCLLCRHSCRHAAVLSPTSRLSPPKSPPQKIPAIIENLKSHAHV
jgi:addiction module HigA family antidote